MPIERARRVVIVQRRLPHYRVPLFEALRQRGRDRDIDIELVYGNPTAAESLKQDSGSISWGRYVECRYAWGGRLCWQDPSAWTRGADLVIVTPENRLLYNFWLQFGPRRSRVGLWGHGANFQGRPDSLRERFKLRVARHADWWFAYTSKSLEPIRRSGFPAQRVTVLNNAIDTGRLAAERASVAPSALESLRTTLGLSGHHVGVFVGSLYGDKRPDFLLEAAMLVREAVPDFELLVVGDGPLASVVTAAARRHAWVHALGPLRGADKAAALALSRVMLNPGLVGLSLLDAFTCGVPMVTTDCGVHSPEIAYLEHDVNGLMTPDTPGAFAAAVVQLLQDDEQLERLKTGCTVAAAEYTVERMADRFIDGIEDCLRSVPMTTHA